MNCKYGLIGETSFAVRMSMLVVDIVYDQGRVFAVLFAETIADALAAITTSLLFFSFYRKTLKNKK